MSKGMLPPHKPGSIAATAENWLERHGIGVLLLAASLMFAMGVALPFMEVQRFFVLTDEFSLIEGTIQLFRDGEWLIATAVFLFSMVFPAAKIGVAFWLWSRVEVGSGRQVTALRWIEGLGKWSMADVFVVAVVIVSAKMSGVATAFTEFGLYAFTASLVTVAIATRMLRRRQ